MRFLIYLSILVSAVALTSCLTIEEKISLNKDGSGSFQTFIDMGEVLGNPMFLGLIKEEMKKNGGPDVPMRMDSTIDLYTKLAQENPQWTDAERDLVRKVNSRMVMDFETQEGGMYVNYDFNSLDELVRIQQLMASSSESEEENSDNPLAGLTGGGAGSLINSTNAYKWKSGSFTRVASFPEAATNGMADEDKETMDMMKMMMEDAKVVYVMEFPGDIKKVKGFPGHSVKGRSVELEFDFLSLIENPTQLDEALDGSVKFKK